MSRNPAISHSSAAASPTSSPTRRERRPPKRASSSSSGKSRPTVRGRSPQTPTPTISNAFVFAARTISQPSAMRAALDTASPPRHLPSARTRLTGGFSMARNRSLFFAAALIACFATACAQQQPAAPPDTRAADEATIRAADADWGKAAIAKDLEKCMSYYTDDAVFLSSGVPATVGKDNIRKVIQGLLAAPGLSFTVNIGTVTV